MSERTKTERTETERTETERQDAPYFQTETSNKEIRNRCYSRQNMYISSGQPIGITRAIKVFVMFMNNSSNNIKVDTLTLTVCTFVFHQL